MMIGAPSVRSSKGDTLENVIITVLRAMVYSNVRIFVATERNKGVERLSKTAL